MHICLRGLILAGVVSIEALSVAQSTPKGTVVPSPPQKPLPLIGTVFNVPPQPVHSVVRIKTNVLSRAQPFAVLKLQEKAGAELPLKPGIYQTSPFACIVVVPDLHMDEKMIKKPLGPDAPILKFEPKLEFIPRSAKPSK